MVRAAAWGLGACLAALAATTGADRVRAAALPAARPPRQDRSAGPVLSLWYRGTPAGTPRADDLAAIRAHGFRGVTWPARSTAGTTDLYRLAPAAGLLVTLRIDPVPLTATSARTPGDAADVVVAGTPPAAIVPLVWRAVAHGAGVVSIDAGPVGAATLDEAGGRTTPWLTAAGAVAAAFDEDAQLLAEWRPIGSVALDAPSDALDFFLRQDDRSWCLVVTNTGRSRARGVARLPAGVPAALWTNLLDGTHLSMIATPAGARWSFEIEAGAARLYVVRR